MSDYFTTERIQDLIDNHNWVLAKQGDIYFLHHKNIEYMKTNFFSLSLEEVKLLDTKKPNAGE